MPGEFAMEEAVLLAQKYKELCEHTSLDTYLDILKPENLLAACAEYMDPSVCNRLMTSEFGQGVLLGYIWSSIDWQEILHEQQKE